MTSQHHESMKTLISGLNITSYQGLLKTALDKTERQTIQTLLRDEEIRIHNGENASVGYAVKSGEPARHVDNDRRKQLRSTQQRVPVWPHGWGELGPLHGIGKLRIPGLVRRFAEVGRIQRLG